MLGLGCGLQLLDLRSPLDRLNLNVSEVDDGLEKDHDKHLVLV